VIADTQGYPYFLQEFGKQAWNVADGTTIELADVAAAVVLALHDLDRASSVVRRRSTGRGTSRRAHR
jgi:hypothetical protein